MIGYLGEYAGKKLRNAAKGDLDMDAADGEDAERRKKAAEDAQPLLKKLTDLLGSRVGEVRVSHRLTESPSCIVLGEHDMALHMQRLLREAGHEVPGGEMILEINPAHPLVRQLETESDGARAEDLGLLLFEEAQLAAGDQLADPAAFIARVNRALLGTPSI
jgi:molecular chaperone HtpG